MNGMQVFSNLEFGSICTIKVDGEPWFVLKDVREAFGETNYRRVAIRLEDDEKGVSQITTPGGKQNMTIHEVCLRGLLHISSPSWPGLHLPVSLPWIVSHAPQIHNVLRKEVCSLR